jgi:hypothetical protein
MGPGLLQLPHPADTVVLQAVDGPEDQRRARQGQDSQQRQRPQPGDQGQQQNAKRDIEDARGKTDTHHQTRAAVLP